MTPLVVEVDGRVLRLEGDRTFRIGRSIEADIVMTAGSASRQHAEIRPVGGTWVVVDAGSQFGTFVNGQRVQEHPIGDRVVVSCGPEAPGSVLTIYPESVAPAELAAPSHAPAPPPLPVSDDVPTSVHPAQPVWPNAEPEQRAGPASSTGPGGVAQPPAPDFPPPAPGDARAGRYDAPPPAPGAQFAPPREPAPPPGDYPPAASPYARGGPGAPAPGGFPMDHTTQGIMVGQAAHGAPGMPPSGPDLLLIAEGREHRFRHPTQITIGRNPDNTVVLSDPAASRQHGQIDPVAGGWVYSNISGEGTFLGGRRITNKNFDERINLRLGHPVAGPEVTLVPILSAAAEEKRIARKRRNKLLTVIGAAAAALVLIAGIVVGSAWLFSRGGEEEPTADPSKGASEASGDTLAELTDEELHSAKAATVRILAESELAQTGQDVAYSGSGSIIREDGLILTNAHVATPGDDDVNEKYGIPDEEVVETPDYLTIAITDPETGESEPTYRAEVVASDGELDAAVLHIIGDEDGDELDEDPELPTVPVGSSADVDLNDPVTVLGFPGVTSSSQSGSDEDSKPITITDGKISTRLDDVDEFDTTARISGGNSGGMAINNDAELIGVPSYGRFDGRGGQSNRLKQVDALKDLIEEAENAVD